MKFNFGIKDALRKAGFGGGSPPAPAVPAVMEDIARDPSNPAAIRSYGALELDNVARLGLYMTGLCKKHDLFYIQLYIQPALQGLSNKVMEARGCLAPYLAAEKEALRRYDEEYIPAARQKFESSRSPGDAGYLGEVEKGKEAFLKRLAVMRDVHEKTWLALEALRGTCKDPEGSLPDLSGFAAAFSEATSAKQRERIAREKAVAAATVLQEPIELGHPLKLTAGKRTAGRSKPGG